MEYTDNFNPKNFITSTNQNSIELFSETVNKMKAASEYIITDFFTFERSKLAEEIAKTDKDKFKAYNYSFYQNIITALTAGMVDDDVYGKGLSALASIISKYPEHKDITIPAVVPLLKQAYKRLETTDNKGKEFLAVGMMHIAGTIATDLEPSKAKEALAIFTDPKVIEGLSIDSQPRAAHLQQHFNSVCTFLVGMLQNDNSLLPDIKEAAKPFLLTEDHFPNKFYYNLTSFLWLQNEINKIEQQNAMQVAAAKNPLSSR